MNPKDALVAAFTDLSHPKDFELLCSESSSWSDACGLGDNLVPSWRDFPAEFAIRHYDAISFLGPLGFRYFIPVYLTAALDDPSGQIAQFLLFYFSDYYDGDSSGTMRQYMAWQQSALSINQLSAISNAIDSIREFNSLN